MTVDAAAADAGADAVTSDPAEDAVPPWVQHTTVVAVSVVAAVAAVTSYVHMFSLAVTAGEGWRAVIAPLSVDGMLVAASMVMLIRRRRRQAAGWLPWLGVGLGVVASLAANVASAPPTPLGWIVSAWPPIALAVSFELLLIVLRPDGPNGQAGSESTLSASTDELAARVRPADVPAAAARDIPHGPYDPAADAPDGSAERPSAVRREPRTNPARTAARDERRRVADVRKWLSDLSADGQEEPTVYAVRKRLGCNRDVAVRVLAAAKSDTVLKAV